MNRCRWQGITRGDVVECGNRSDMLHGGVLPVEYCNGCQFRKPADFFSDTSRLIQLQNRDYVQPPKSCGSCGTVKRRDTATQFIWPYWHGGAHGDEIRFSVRSVETFFQGAVKCTIIGDRPPWYTGHVIPQERVPVQSNRGFRDMLAKMWTMATHAEIDSEFVWMMDDIYLLRPVTWEDLETPRAYPWREDRSNSWQRRKSNTMRMLRDSGKPNHDYATHLPHTVEKSKLRQIYESFNLHQNCLLWEVVYGNTFRGRPYAVHPFFSRITQQHSADELHRVTAEASVMNHLAGCWTPEMRKFLESRLPEPTASETIQAGFRPAFKRVARTGTRAVKRRHPSTHKAQQ
jgi:hypothetical protein